MNYKQSLQVSMHKDFFDRCKFAIDNGFYFEAIIMEYAAIESRLESICSILGLPCSKDSPNRGAVKISNRISCINHFINHNTLLFSTTKLPTNYYKDKGVLNDWIDCRNTFVHGLYKNEYKYKERIDLTKQLASEGIALARKLYNETKRLKRLFDSHPEIANDVVRKCKNSKCNANNIENKKQ